MTLNETLYRSYVENNLLLLENEMFKIDYELRFDKYNEAALCILMNHFLCSIEKAELWSVWSNTTRKYLIDSEIIRSADFDLLDVE